MKRKFAIILIASMILSLATGCTNKDEGTMIRPVGQGTADELNAEHSKFETSEDPPFTADTRFAAGQLAESQGVPQRAAVQYEQALKVNPTMLSAAYRLGVVYTQMRDYPKAIAAWKHYTEMTGGSATAYGNLGFCYEVAGQREQAVQAYQEGIAKEPKNQLCRVNYGLMLARTGHVDEGLEQLQAVLSPAEAHYDLGSVYEQQGRADQARQEYTKALQLNPAMWEAQTRLDAINKK